jgi:hypothetical protein
MMRMAHDLVVLEFTPCPHLSRPPAPFSPLFPVSPSPLTHLEHTRCLTVCLLSRCASPPFP